MTHKFKYALTLLNIFIFLCEMYSNWKHIFSVNTIWIIYYSVCHIHVLYIIQNAHAVRMSQFLWLKLWFSVVQIIIQIICYCNIKWACAKFWLKSRVFFLICKEMLWTYLKVILCFVSHHWGVRMYSDYFTFVNCFTNIESSDYEHYELPYLSLVQEEAVALIFRQNSNLFVLELF